MNGWKETTTTVSIPLPAPDGNSIAETREVEVPAWISESGEIFLDHRADAIIDGVKARYFGLLTPSQLKELRNRLELTQSQITELLQIGEKSWTRWETGKERPSRSMNLLLCAIYDGIIDRDYLRTQTDPTQRSLAWTFRQWSSTPCASNPISTYQTEPAHATDPEALCA